MGGLRNRGLSSMGITFVRSNGLITTGVMGNCATRAICCRAMNRMNCIGVASFCSAATSRLGGTIGALVGRNIDNVVVSLQTISGKAMRCTTSTLSILIPITDSKAGTLTATISGGNRTVRAFASSTSDVGISAIVLISGSASKPTRLFTYSVHSFNGTGLVNATAGNGKAVREICRLDSNNTMGLAITRVGPCADSICGNINLAPSCLIRLSSRGGGHLTLLSRSRSRRCRGTGSLLASSTNTSRRWAAGVGVGAPTWCCTKNTFVFKMVGVREVNNKFFGELHCELFPPRPIVRQVDILNDTPFFALALIYSRGRRISANRVCDLLKQYTNEIVIYKKAVARSRGIGGFRPHVLPSIVLFGSTISCVGGYSLPPRGADITIVSFGNFRGSGLSLLIPLTSGLGMVANGPRRFSPIHQQLCSS